MQRDRAWRKYSQGLVCYCYTPLQSHKNPCKNLTQQNEKHCDDTLNALYLHGNKTNNNTEITKRGIIQVVLNIANNDKIVK